MVNVDYCGIQYENYSKIRFIFWSLIFQLKRKIRDIPPETLEQGWTMFKVNDKNTKKMPAHIVLVLLLLTLSW